MREIKTKIKNEAPKGIVKSSRTKRKVAAPLSVVTEKRIIKTGAKKVIIDKTDKADAKRVGGTVTKMVKEKTVKDINKEIKKKPSGIEKDKDTASHPKRIRSKKATMQNQDDEIKDDNEKEAGSKNRIQDKEEETENGEDETFVKWVGKSFLRPEGERFFYQVSLVASLIVFLWSVFDGSWLAAATFLVLVVIIVFELKDVPRDVDYEITIDGISIDGRLYRFDDVHSFELSKKGEFDIVKLQMRSSFFPIKELHLAEGQDLVYIETLLEYFLPKEKQEDVLFNFRRREAEEKELTEDEFIDQKVTEYMDAKR